MKIRIAGIVNDSITDGPGIRLTVFGQGCPHGCKGCHNPETHTVHGGYEVEVEELADIAMRNPLLDGLTISGGEPFLQPQGFGELAVKAKNLGLSVITYTGYKWEELGGVIGSEKLLENSDFIVDGKYDAAKRSLELEFKGSQNQRFIDVHRSLKEGIVREVFT